MATHRPPVLKPRPLHDFSVTLNHYRHLKGWSQRELARKSDVSQADISQYESGKMEPLLTPLIKLARALDMGITELAGFI